MTTKEQERQAIKKIQAIIEGLGNGSYIAAAMEGVLELAEENIRDDAMYSWKNRATTAQQRADRTETDLRDATKELQLIREQMKEAHQELTERRRECINLRMKQGDAEDLIEVVRIQQAASEKKANNAAASMAYAVMNGEEQAKEFAQRWNEETDRADRCRELDAMLQKYMRESR